MSTNNICCQNIVKNGAHPAWRVPCPVSAVPKLVVRNSLTDTKEPLTPAEGNIVRMYVCGPTVYSVSHMGHARTFLCFDILRRILEKYFRYNVLYQLNITDVDDKIILTARKNELLRLYKAESHPIATVKETIQTLAEHEAQKLASKREAMLSNKPAEDSREFAEYDTQVKQLELKIKQLSQVQERLTKEEFTSADDLIEVGKDLLMNSLDAEKGDTISDKSIFDSHARYYEDEFLKDCKDLGIREPDVLTRVTEFVPEIVTFVEKIISNGYAYESNGSVYFNTQKFREVHDYPKLVPKAGSGATDAEIAEGEGALAGGANEKLHRNDFALWKKSKPGEPRWDSPWGEGRPGWHIECSVMATAVHGSVLDIHGGGVDLRFPHHDNELAQTEAHFESDQWVNYFLHAGHLHIEGLKMAKSLKNFITIRQALETFTAKQIRIMFLLQQWDKPVNFSDQTLNEARDKENRINSFFARVDQTGRNFPVPTSQQKWDQFDNKLAEEILSAQENVHAALCDNFNTPKAMESIEKCISSVNQYMIEQSLPKYPLLLRAKDFVSGILSVFGVIDESSSSSSSDTEKVNDIVTQFVATRDRIRELATETKNPELMKLSDSLRDEVFVNLGIKVVDGNKGTDTWSHVNREELRREVEIREQERKVKELVKLENKRGLIEKEIAKWNRHVTGQSEREVLFPDATVFDEEGLPNDPAITASKKKSMKKDLEKFRKERADFEAKGGKQYYEKLQADFNALVEQINAMGVSQSK